jgi:hypothetical protein
VYPARVQELAGARAFMDWIRAEAEIFRTSVAVSNPFRG